MSKGSVEEIHQIRRKLILNPPLAEWLKKGIPHEMTQAYFISISYRSVGLSGLCASTILNGYPFLTGMALDNSNLLSLPVKKWLKCLV